MQNTASLCLSEFTQQAPQNMCNKTAWNSDDFRSCYKVKTHNRFTETFAKVHQPVEWTWAQFQANLDWLMFSLNQHHLTFFATEVNLLFSLEFCIGLSTERKTAHGMHIHLCSNWGACIVVSCKAMKYCKTSTLLAPSISCTIISFLVRARGRTLFKLFMHLRT